MQARLSAVCQLQVQSIWGGGIWLLLPGCVTAVYSPEYKSNYGEVVVLASLLKTATVCVILCWIMFWSCVAAVVRCIPVV